MLRTLFLIVPFLLLVHVSSAVALPPCPTDPNGYFDNCEGRMEMGLPGEYYEGEWKNNNFHGHGTLNNSIDGTKYVGGWRDGKKHGQGNMSGPEFTYSGGWKDGEMHGYGTFSVHTVNGLYIGSTYVGEWKDGRQHGHGTEIYADGSKYVGEWKNSLRHGHGTYTYARDSFWHIFDGTFQINLSGSVYDGDFEGDELNGSGTLFWANGDVWVGLFGNNDDLIIAANWLSGNKYTAGNVPPEVYAARGGDAPPSSQNKSPQQQTQRPDADEIIPASSGSGFVISKAGHIVSNHHVIEGCNQVEVHQKGKSYKATVIEIDIINDLAVLQANFTPTAIFSINSQNAQLSQDVWVAGYPFGDALSTSVKVTKGIVSSLAGIGNNYSNMQIDAALQPGNSGGPILDEHGNVVGVAVAKLDLKLSLEAFDVVPENTNFGIKSSVLKNFLDANGIATLQASDGAISTAERARKITDGTLFLSCLMTYAQIEKLRAEKVMFSDLD